MFHFNIDGRDGYTGGNGCQTCCCEAVTAKPGEVNKWVLNYAMWTRPIGGRGVSINTEFDIQPCSSTPAASSGNQPPQVLPSLNTTLYNTPLSSTLVPFATDADADTLTFSLLPLAGPKHGELVLNTDGTFTYTPHANWAGVDRFFWQVSDGVHKPVVSEAVIRTEPPLPALPIAVGPNDLTPIIRVKPINITTNSQMQTVSFPVEVSPAARVGDVYKMTVKQEALDCDCVPYYHISCYDILIGKCG